MTRKLQSLWRTRDGSVIVEFAMVGPIFLMLLLFVLGAGLLFWAKEAVQMTAWSTARCTAIGSSACASPQAYAASLLSDWGVTGIIPSIIVTVQSGTTCGGGAGSFNVVTITSAGDTSAGFIAPLSGTVLSASACYPLAATNGTGPGNGG